MKIEDLKHGKEVQFIEAAGLGDKKYVVHSIDQMSWTVRLNGAMGSYSIDHIIGFDATPTIPTNEVGTLRTAAAFPTSVPRVLPQPENPKTEDGDSEEDSTTTIPSVFDALRGLEVVDLLDALESHLQALAAHPDPLVKYHARNAIMIQWTIESLPDDGQLQESPQEGIKEDDSKIP